MKKQSKYKKAILNIAHALESLLSMIVLFAVLLGSLDLLVSLWNMYVVNHAAVGYQELNNFLGQVILLVIGIELVVMFSLHIPAALLEVLAFAIAYKIVMIPKSEGMKEILFGVIALAGLFAIKKFLIKDTKCEDKESDSDFVV